jgi:hypothetical protein
MKIIAVIGLPGSGKSHYLDKFKNNPDYLIIDDPKNISEIPLDISKNILIADCHLCRTTVRDSFKNIITKLLPNHSIEIVFFENNPTQCLKNVEYRNDGRKVEATIIQYSKKYEIPEGSKVIPVFNTELLKNKRKNKNTL